MTDIHKEIFIRSDKVTRTVLSFVSKEFLKIFHENEECEPIKVTSYLTEESELPKQKPRRIPKSKFLSFTETDELLIWGISMNCPSTYPIHRNLVKRGRLDILSSMKDVDTYSVLQLSVEYDNLEIFQHYSSLPVGRKLGIFREVKSLELLEFAYENGYNEFKEDINVRKLLSRRKFDILTWLFDKNMIDISHFSQEDVVIVSEDPSLFKRVVTEEYPEKFYGVWRLEALRLLNLSRGNLEASTLAGSLESFEYCLHILKKNDLGLLLAESPSLAIVKKYAKVDFDFFKHAVERGCVEVVNYLFSLEDYSERKFIVEDCKDLEVIKILHERGYSFSNRVFNLCVSREKYEHIEWFLSILNPSNYNYTVLDDQAWYVSFPIIKLLHEHGFKVNTRIVSVFARLGNLEALKWFNDRGYKYWYRDSIHGAIRMGSYDVLEWLISAGCDISREMVEIAIENSHLHLYRLFYEKAYYCIEGVVPKNVLIIDFLRDRNCKLADRGV